jgi:hemerythrin-like domain-containing protein
MSDDVIVMLREDHREIRRAFRAFDRTGDTETAQRGEIVDHIIDLVSAHGSAETDVLYPRMRELVPRLDHDVLESGVRLGIADELASDLRSMEAYDERFTATARVLIELVSRHMDHEETELFPEIRAALGRKELQLLGRELRARRDEAPRSDSQSVGGVVRALFS